MLLFICWPQIASRMKYHLLIITILFFSCSSNSGRTDEQTKSEAVEQPTKMLIEIKSEPVDSLRSPFHRAYYSDVPLRTVAELVLSDSIKLMDNDLTFTLMQQITVEDKSTRDYFFPTFKFIMNEADGALAEVVGLYAKQYAERYPNEFLNRFECCNSDSNCCDDLVKFSKFIHYEIGMSTDIDQAYSDFLSKIETDERQYPDVLLIVLLVDNITNGLGEYR